MRRLITLSVLALGLAGCGSGAPTTSVTATVPTTVVATVTKLMATTVTETPTAIPAATVAACKQFEAALNASGLGKLARTSALGPFKNALRAYVSPKYGHGNAATVAMDTYSHLIEATKSKAFASINANDLDRVTAATETMNAVCSGIFK